MTSPLKRAGYGLGNPTPVTILLSRMTSPLKRAGYGLGNPAFANTPLSKRINMLIDVDNRTIELRAWNLDIKLASNESFNSHPYVIREVTNMFPESHMTLRRFTEKDGCDFRYRAMLHAAHFLGFDPFNPPIRLGGWADMFPLPNWRELQELWDMMFPPDEYK